MSPTKYRTRRIRKLGQHLLVSPEIADRIVDASHLRPEDTVLEIGTGQGALTGRIAQLVKRVRSYEVDRIFYGMAKTRLSRYQNIDLICGDAFEQEIETSFDVCVTNLPYSKSLKFIKWLVTRPHRFRLAVAMLQSEFADKIISAPRRDSYRAVSLIAQLSFQMQSLFAVGPSEFVPQPRVTSEVVRFTPKEGEKWPVIDTNEIRLLNSLFSFRGRRLSSALQKIVGGEVPSSFAKELMVKRIETLSPQEFFLILKKIEVQTDEPGRLSL